MDISVVIPLYNEEESLPELYAWIERVMKANHFTYEVIFVNDGSTDRSWGRDTVTGKKPRMRKGHQIPPQLRQKPRPVLRFQRGPGRRRNNDGRRPARLSRRDTRPLPDDNRRRI